MPKAHHVSFRVYYEDTDAGGVVYYANYLKFAERARTELLRHIGINQSNLVQTHQLYFVVRHATLDLKKAAKLVDELTIATTISSLSGPRIIMEQSILLEENEIAAIAVQIACVNTDFRPVRLPEDLKETFIPFLTTKPKEK